MLVEEGDGYRMSVFGGMRVGIVCVGVLILGDVWLLAVFFCGVEQSKRPGSRKALFGNAECCRGGGNLDLG